MKSKFRQYQRTAIAEMREVTKGDIQDFHREGKITIPPDAFGDRKNPYRVSISDADLANGSPTIGDMIARNPENHTDQWLVAEDYFKANFKLKE